MHIVGMVHCLTSSVLSPKPQMTKNPETRMTLHVGLPSEMK